MFMRETTLSPAKVFVTPGSSRRGSVTDGAPPRPRRSLKHHRAAEVRGAVKPAVRGEENANPRQLRWRQSESEQAVIERSPRAPSVDAPSGAGRRSTADDDRLSIRRIDRNTPCRNAVVLEHGAEPRPL